ncbi:MAG: hypothetical protein GX963_12325 [Bacteroidales bacterium]|nr:hypothetical protein [Bacteroidales bacterium]
MEKELLLKPYLSVGSIKFGMKRNEVEALFGREPEFEHKDFLDRTNLGWGEISVIINKKNQVEEITFSPTGDFQVIWNDIDILNDSDVIKKLNKFEKSSKTEGVKLYFTIGIALTGVGNAKEKSKSLSVFSKDLEKKWRKYIK